MRCSQDRKGVLQKKHNFGRGGKGHGAKGVEKDLGGKEAQTGNNDTKGNNDGPLTLFSPAKVDQEQIPT